MSLDTLGVFIMRTKQAFDKNGWRVVDGSR
jgi:hypothetical protein